MSSLQFVNAKADILRKAQALAVNINAAKGLQEVLKTNLGPKGTIKMYVIPSQLIDISYRLVGGAGQVKLTKDGNVLLHEMVTHFASCLYFGLANPTPHCCHDR